MSELETLATSESRYLLAGSQPPAGEGTKLRRRPASQREGERGFLCRYDGFDETRRKAERFRGTDHAKIVILAAVRSIRGLTPAERQVLAEAVDIIPRADFKVSTAGIVYARNRVFADRCGLALDTVKAARRGLEQKGFALRHVSGDNNGGRLDIRPFLADIDQHIEARLTRDAARHRDDEIGETFDTIQIEEDPPGGGCLSPPIQSSKAILSPVPPPQSDGGMASAKAAEQSLPETDAARSQSVGRRRTGAAAPIAGRQSARPKPNRTIKCSPKGAGTTLRGKPARSGDCTAKEALLMAYRASPRWRQLVSLVDIEQLLYDRLFASLYELVKRHFPEPERNPDLTVAWGIEQYGWKAIIMAVVSLEDPNVLKPTRYFGWLVTQATDIDIGKNLDWIANHVAELERDLAAGDAGNGPDVEGRTIAPGRDSSQKRDGTAPASAGSPILPITATAGVPDPPEWRMFVDRFRELRRTHGMTNVTFARVYGGLGFVSFSSGVLTLSATEARGIQTIAPLHAGDIMKAAREAGWRLREFKIMDRQ